LFWLTTALGLVLLPPAVEGGTGDTSIWDVWSSDPDEYEFNSQQQRYQYEGRLRFAALKGDIEGFAQVLEKGKALDPPLNINTGDPLNGRSALHFAAQEGYGGDLYELNSTRRYPPEDNVGLFGDPSFQWGEQEYSHTFLFQAYMLTTQYPEGLPPGASLPYVFNLPWCNEPGNTCPMTLDMDARDNAGNNAIMEALVHNNPLTVRTLVEVSSGASAPPGGLTPSGGRAYEQDEFVRNEQLDIEWGIGWAMMNWISLNGRDWALSEIAMDNADQYLRDAMQAVADNPKLGLTVLDYAVLWDRSDMVRFLLSRQSGLLTAESNWGERPIHKAAFQGHTDVVRLLVKVPWSLFSASFSCFPRLFHVFRIFFMFSASFSCFPRLFAPPRLVSRAGPGVRAADLAPLPHPPQGPADCQIVEATSMGLETPVLLASVGGHITTLEYLRATCPAQFAQQAAQPASTELAWQSQNPCDIAVYSISKAREWCGDEIGCPGYYRWRCSNDRMKECNHHHDCQRGDKSATCLEPPLREEMPLSDLISHWQSCVAVCPAARRQSACGPSFDGSSYDGFSG